MVAANGNNGVGISGIGWSLKHRMLRVSNQSDGGAQLSVLQHAARTSIESGDRIANVSYQGAWYSSNAATATYIKELGGLYIWGSGNTGSSINGIDRDSDDMIVVGATDMNDNMWSSTTHGRFMDLVAPGAGIFTTDRYSDNDYATASGTSYASPAAAGVCAMIWGQNPTLSPSDVERILKLSSTDLGAPGIDDFYGYGRVQLNDALNFAATAIPSARMGAIPREGSTPMDVAFRDLSTGVPTAWSWDFGDGTTSTLQNPVHTFTASGAYTVTLTVTNALGQDQSVEVDFILADIIPPVAEFSATPTSGLAPLPVQFTDESGGGPATNWTWDFGDGTTSNMPNPLHTYTTSGIFDVSLTVSNSYGSDVRVYQNHVAVDFIPPVAEFSALPTSGASPLVVDFTDQSTAGVATSWTWYFGDGYGSTLQNPTHTYTAQGDYTVYLRVTNAWGMDELWKSSYISVGAGPPLVADFVGTPTTGTSPLTVQFTDLSIGHVTEWEWNFGDGSKSFDQNPVHTYLTPGEYDVALAVGNAAGADNHLERGSYVIVQ